ncbi:thiamine pyrophosphate-dependent dehydrogenase E1 component subunit alpha [Nevskia sp.]|uniref:thiamine pyrophosphate-dependent dehydrogenase E1 component subunit alpha n=1 Tax=Nevskia sp. TaxID=1929292 RepID=UPI003F7278B8
MIEPSPATTRVAAFEVFLTRYLNPDGSLTADPPAFARDRAQARAMYALMVRTRLFDKKAVALQRTGLLGTYAAVLGQEAIGTAIGHALAAEDIFIPAYREYAAQFARGVPMHAILQYWGGDERGMAYPEGTPSHHDFPLSVPIATHVPHAIGVAYAIKLKQERRVVLASCGDGATSKGDWYEAISAARIWNLPIVFLVSNNGWAISMPSHRQTGAATFAQKGLAGGLPSEQVDGNDVIATRAVLSAAIERARDGGGPSLIEALTYRLHDHTTADDARRYRAEAEVAAAWERCPVKRYKAYLEAAGFWSADDEAALIADGTAAAEAAAQTFLNLPPQAPEAIFDHLYAELPLSMRWQRDEVRARGPVDGGHG